MDFSSTNYRFSSPSDSLKVQLNLLFSVNVDDQIIRASKIDVKPDHVIHPDTPPLEIVLLLHKGANNVPVVDRDGGRLVGMVSARDLLTALRPGEGK